MYRSSHHPVPLQTNNFVDLLKMVITLKVVVKMLRIKIEAMKVCTEAIYLYLRRNISSDILPYLRAYARRHSSETPHSQHLHRLGACCVAVQVVTEITSNDCIELMVPVSDAACGTDVVLMAMPLHRSVMPRSARHVPC
jgi:hypothetical protein